MRFFNKIIVIAFHCPPDYFGMVVKWLDQYGEKELDDIAPTFVFEITELLNEDGVRGKEDGEGINECHEQQRQLPIDHAECDDDGKEKQAEKL